MKKILFIEDESALQRAIKDVLNQSNYKIISALDGETGIKMAERELPDLILLDLILPVIDGFSVLKEIKKNDKTRGIPVIVLTNLEDVKNIDRAIELGAKAYLVKADYGVNDVAKKIKEILGDKS